MEIEEKTDYKTCTPEVLYEARKTVIKMWKKDKPIEEIAEITGFATNTIYIMIRKYKAGGISALKPQKRGRKSGCEVFPMEIDLRIFSAPDSIARRPETASTSAPKIFISSESSPPAKITGLIVDDLERSANCSTSDRVFMSFMLEESNFARWISIS